MSRLKLSKGAFVFGGGINIGEDWRKILDCAWQDDISKCFTTMCNISAILKKNDDVIRMSDLLVFRVNQAFATMGLDYADPLF